MYLSESKLPFKCLGSIRFFDVLSILCSPRLVVACGYLIKNIIKTEILRNIVII